MDKRLYVSSSYLYEDLQNARELYQQRFGKAAGSPEGAVEVFPSHIGPDGRVLGYIQAYDPMTAVEVERILRQEVTPVRERTEQMMAASLQEYLRRKSGENGYA